MSKSSKRPGPTPRGDREPNARTAGTAGSNPPVEETLVDIAEDLGKLLGTAQNRMSSWLGERQQIATQLVQIRDTANAYLRELTAGGATLAAAIERGRRAAPGGSTKRSIGERTEPPHPIRRPGRRPVRDARNPERGRPCYLPSSALPSEAGRGRLPIHRLRYVTPGHDPSSSHDSDRCSRPDRHSADSGCRCRLATVSVVVDRVAANPVFLDEHVDSGAPGGFPVIRPRRIEQPHRGLRGAQIGFEFVVFVAEERLEGEGVVRVARDPAVLHVEQELAGAEVVPCRPSSRTLATCRRGRSGAALRAPQRTRRWRWSARADSGRRSSDC